MLENAGSAAVTIRAAHSIWREQGGWFDARWHFSFVIYMISGALQVEFGAGGAETLDRGVGDFLYVAPGAVHRESNPSDQESHIVVVRSAAPPAIASPRHYVDNADGPRSRG
jgi:uncharacterized RmlC-like cupin family protein